ncbi:MAG TPA: DUF115 domain-containing protein, partial [Synergistaceae bacterium]|nr:DUF115 domain-containing protein [Synergistaceae bacterium]
RILRALPQEALAVVVVEPSLEALLFTLSRTSVFQALPQGCRICFLVEDRHALLDEALLWTLVPMGIFPAKNLHLIVHPGQAEAVPQLRSLGEALRKEILYRLSLLGNSPEDTLLGFRHAVLNTRRILESPSMEDLKKIFGGRSFVCVATGPSLEKNVDLLKGLENKCIITACDTALLPLLKRGIRPHVVTTIERPYNMYRIWVQKVLREFPEECSHILLISQSVSYPMTAGRWPGPHMVIGKQEVPVDNWYTGSILGKNLLYSGLSVAHMNLTFAFAMGASSVALLGQDLAYTPEGESHIAQAVTKAIEAKEKARRKFSVPAALGGTVETQEIWLVFLQIFERLLEATQKEVYDCTEGGALIRGTIICPFREYIHAHLS